MPSLFPGIPAAPERVRPAPGAAGKIGALATLYGVGTKADGELDPAERYMALPDDRLLPTPAIGEGWEPEAVTRKLGLIARAAAAGDIRQANLWTVNLGRPRSRFSDLDGLERMVLAVERGVAARNRQLVPVEPAVIFGRLDEIPAIGGAGGAVYGADVLPAEVAASVLQAINERLRALARAGFADRHDRAIHRAPADIRALVSQISCLTGATVRAINQIGHLLTVSRQGQTAHIPMTLDRRLLLVDSALSQLAEDVGGPTWSAVALDLVTAEIRQAWQDRAAAEPLRERFPRNLFDWATEPTRHPAALADAEVLQLIQTHPDLGFVEALRVERRRRGL